MHPRVREALECRAIFGMAVVAVVCILLPFLCLPVERLVVFVTWACTLAIVDFREGRSNALLRLTRGGLCIVLIVTDLFLLIEVSLEKPVYTENANGTMIDTVENNTIGPPSPATSLSIFYVCFVCSTFMFQLQRVREMPAGRATLVMIVFIQVVSCTSFEVVYGSVYGDDERAPDDERLGSQCLISMAITILMASTTVGTLLEIQRKIKEAQQQKETQLMEKGFNACFAIVDSGDEEEEEKRLVRR